MQSGQRTRRWARLGHGAIWLLTLCMVLYYPRALNARPLPRRRRNTPTMASLLVGELPHGAAVGGGSSCSAEPLRRGPITEQRTGSPRRSAAPASTPCPPGPHGGAPAFLAPRHRAGRTRLPVAAAERIHLTVHATRSVRVASRRAFDQAAALPARSRLSGFLFHPASAAPCVQGFPATASTSPTASQTAHTTRQPAITHAATRPQRAVGVVISTATEPAHE